MIKRVTLIVLDSLGVGELPDAGKYDDEGADTLGHIVAHCPQINIPHLRKLGFGNIDGAAGGRLRFDETIGAFGRLAEKSTGKDTVTGHWEIAGLYTDKPFPTYPDGFPADFIREYEKAIETEVLGNYSSSGTEIIEKLGGEHEATGKPIVYTSADSVFQIAANTDVIPLERLYEICRIARKMLTGEVSCGRVIARPYVIKDGKRKRTADRKDYAASPPRRTLLDNVKDSGRTVYAVGKINDIFNGQGISEGIHIESNMDGVDKTLEAMSRDFPGLIFTNLVDFDSEFGHRRDVEGYARAIEEFDSRLPEITAAMRESDVLILCADHGNDPTFKGWNHTREYVPVVIYGSGIKAGVNLGTGNSYADIGASIAEMLDAAKTEIGESFCDKIIDK